jgi:hypothetical protein
LLEVADQIGTSLYVNHIQAPLCTRISADQDGSDSLLGCFPILQPVNGQRLHDVSNENEPVLLLLLYNCFNSLHKHLLIHLACQSARIKRMIFHFLVLKEENIDEGVYSKYKVVDDWLLEH